MQGEAATRGLQPFGAVATFGGVLQLFRGFVIILGGLQALGGFGDTPVSPQRRRLETASNVGPGVTAATSNTAHPQKSPALQRPNWEPHFPLGWVHSALAYGGFWGKMMEKQVRARYSCSVYGTGRIHCATPRSVNYHRAINRAEKGPRAPAGPSPTPPGPFWH